MCSFKWDKKYAELLHINVKVTYLPDPEFCKSLDNFLHRFRLDICEPLCGLLLLEEKTPRMKYNTSFSSLQKRSLDTKDGFLARFASAEALICPRRLRATTSPPFCTPKWFPGFCSGFILIDQWAARSTAHQSAPGAKCLKTGNSFFLWRKLLSWMKIWSWHWDRG